MMSPGPYMNKTVPYYVHTTGAKMFKHVQVISNLEATQDQQDISNELRLHFETRTIAENKRTRPGFTIPQA
jgi:hypothetical protein